MMKLRKYASILMHSHKHRQEHFIGRQKHEVNIKINLLSGIENDFNVVSKFVQFTAIFRISNLPKLLNRSNLSNLLK